MKRIPASLAAVAVLMAGSSAYALYSVFDEGIWPKSWPAELDSSRKQSRTLVGPWADHHHYEIPFTRREDFESAWPHLLTVKSDGAPVILIRPDENRFMTVPAGVVIHAPPEGTDKQVHPEKPLPGSRRDQGRWMWTTYIELVVDGKIVDLNRIPLPGDTPIIDRRFEIEEEKAVPAQAAGSLETRPTPPASAK